MRWRRTRTASSRARWRAPAPAIATATVWTARGPSPIPPRAFSRTACTGRPRSSIRVASSGRMRAGAASSWRASSPTSSTSALSTSAARFEGVARRLPHLRDLGVTALELMPLADFAGQPRLGLRRRRSLRPGPLLRAARRPAPPGRRGASVGTRCDSRRRVQPPRSGRRLSRHLQPRLLLEAPPHPLGGGGQPRRPAQRPGARVLHRERVALGARVPRRRPPPGCHARPGRRRPAALPRRALEPRPRLGRRQPDRAA